MTFFDVATCTVSIAGLAMMAYAGNGGAWLPARLMDPSESTPPTTSVLFATVPADALFYATERIKITRSPFAEINLYGNGTERIEAKLELARATNARNEARSPWALSGGSAVSRTRVGHGWAAKASQARRSAQRRTSFARSSRRDENRLPRQATNSSRQRRSRNPRYFGRSS